MQGLNLFYDGHVCRLALESDMWPTIPGSKVSDSWSEDILDRESSEFDEADTDDIRPPRSNDEE